MVFSLEFYVNWYSSLSGLLFHNSWSSCLSFRYSFASLCLLPTNQRQSWHSLCQRSSSWSCLVTWQYLDLSLSWLTTLCWSRCALCLHLRHANYQTTSTKAGSCPCAYPAHWSSGSRLSPPTWLLPMSLCGFSCSLQPFFSTTRWLWCSFSFRRSTLGSTYHQKKHMPCLPTDCQTALLQ